MVRQVHVYSEQALTPRAIEVLRTIKAENGFQDVTFIPYMGQRGTGNVLVFGNKVPEDAPGSVKFIHTYSIAQMMSKPNAMTVITAALRLYFGEAHEVPLGVRPTMVTNPKFKIAYNFGIDFDKPTAIDIETDGNLDKEDTVDEVNIISVALYQEGRNPIVYMNPRYDDVVGTHPLDSEMLEMLAEELPKFTKAIYHNGKFDTRVLNRVLGIKLCVWFDTMLAHHVLNIAAGAHGLKILAQQYLGAPDWEVGIKQYLKNGGHYENIPWENLVEYNGWDVYWTYQLWLLFESQIEQDDNNSMAFMLEMAAADMLLDVEVNGLPIDVEATEALSAEQEQIMQDHKLHMQVLTGRDKFNPNSPKQVKEVLADWGVEVASTDEKNINHLLDTFAPTNKVYIFCTSLMKFRKASKIRGTYAEGWLNRSRNGRVHPTFLVHGTSTGRLSSTNPNAQNMPREKSVRKIVGVT